jgi:hypothetical protein
MTLPENIERNHDGIAVDTRFLGVAGLVLQSDAEQQLQLGSSLRRQL